MSLRRLYPVLLLLLLAVGCGRVTAVPASPSATPSQSTQSPTPSESDTATASPSATDSPSPSFGPTSEPSGVPSDSPEPSGEPTGSPDPSDSPTYQQTSDCTVLPIPGASQQTTSKINALRSVGDEQSADFTEQGYVVNGECVDDEVKPTQLFQSWYEENNDYTIDVQLGPGDDLRVISITFPYGRDKMYECPAGDFSVEPYEEIDHLVYADVKTLKKLGCQKVDG